MEINNDIWWIYMEDYCNEDHINTIGFQFLDFLRYYSNSGCITQLQQYILYHNIEYNYNLLIGYILVQTHTIQNLEEVIEEPDKLTLLTNKLQSTLDTPEKYITQIENRYPDILIDIETKQVALLVIAKQRNYLEYLQKNGEIGEKVYDNLQNKLQQKEYNLHNFIREHNH